MVGFNRAKSNLRQFTEARKSRGVKCVFLSHQKSDSAICKKIAEYLLNAGIDVYFDEFDNDLKLYRQRNRPEGVVNSIRKGINSSSHMIVVISPRTISSRWVPWEIGYGYDKIDLSVLTLKGIGEGELPDYLKTAKILRSTKMLNNFLSNLTNISTSIMESRGLIKSYATKNHPLDKYLEWKN
ncbi:MAG: toll/interleukin-1 receptor domain-containing protein [Candidatus Paceibacterota bacterium]